ncbi:MAG: ABC transporter ATP-binding protein [Thermoleophilaceae bacterium]
MSARGARVEVKNVTRRFDRGQAVLRGISCTLEPGQLVALTGPSGAGKSTLLQLVGGLDRPDEGSIHVDSICVSEQLHPVALRRHVVGFVFQLHNLLPALTALANVELPLVAAHVGHDERRQRALAALEEAGVSSKAMHLPSELSGGERQRVALARAIVHRPRLLLADEPTAGLDHASAERVAALLEEIRTERGATVLAVSHDPYVLDWAERVLELFEGLLVEPPMAVPAQGVAQC